jgi:type IV pilus assembly protein PilN
MIRINLLPVKAGKKRETGQQQLLAFLFALIVAGVGLFYWYNLVEGDIETLNGQVGAARTQLAQLKKKAGDLSEYEAREKDLKERLSQIESLQRTKIGPVRMLAEISRRIPSRVWLTAVEEKANKMTLSGAALSYDDVSEFSRQLRESGYFSNIEARQQEEQPSPIPGMNFVVFRLVCDTKYSI